MNLTTTILVAGGVAAFALASLALEPSTAPVSATGMVSATSPAPVQAIGLAELSEESRDCIECHRQASLSIYEEWGKSRHFRGKVGCYECHRAEEDDVDVLLHYDYAISAIVSPMDCARCHSKEAEQFLASHHARAVDLLDSPELRLAEVVAGNRAFVTPGFPEGNSAAVVTGCWSCHGSPVKLLPDGHLDPATWPNTGIGRRNPDGTVGSCSACHMRHRFSVEQARHPETCGRCHTGPDHPQREIYEGSKHGVAFRAHLPEMALGSDKWVVGEDYSAAPTCATCHMSATVTSPVHHDVGMRISWNNRDVFSVRPELADARLGLEGKHVSWTERRSYMQKVCISCHGLNLVDSTFQQYYAIVALYNDKFAAPGQELYELARPLLRPVQFANELDFIWFELWHDEGRRARHGASMGSAEYSSSRGTYELGKHFYTRFLPKIEELIEKGLASDDATRVEAAGALKAKLDAILATEDHRWFLGG
jgi:hydroxylamine dehydrogenase